MTTHRHRPAHDGGRMTYTQRHRHLMAQRAYQRTIRARGLSALLAPYTLHTPTVPAQRQAPQTPTRVKP